MEVSALRHRLDAIEIRQAEILVIDGETGAALSSAIGLTGKFPRPMSLQTGERQGMLVWRLIWAGLRPERISLTVEGYDPAYITVGEEGSPIEHTVRLSRTKQ